MSTSTATALLVVVVAGAAMWVLRAVGVPWRWKRRGKGAAAAVARVPPGSFGWPVVGETLDFVSCAYSPRPEAFIDKRRLR